MYKALDVAQHIVNYCNEQNYFINNNKLQQFLYMIQAYYLVRLDKPCFDEDIIAWELGPSVPEVYKEFRYFCCNNIRA